MENELKNPSRTFQSGWQPSLFPITHITKKRHSSSQQNFFFTLFKLYITFYFKCYLHNCTVDLNRNNAQLYSSAKPLRNVPSSVFWIENFCFLSFLHRTSIQKCKKNWFYHARMWIGKKEMSVKISKCLCQNMFIGAATQIRAVYKEHKILIILKRCISLSLSF